MKPTVIAPSILSSDFGRLADEIRAVEAAGADWIHVDVMDGHFVPNLTFGPPVIRKVRGSTELPFDVHLMIEQPERSLQDYADAGADRLTIHCEATRHLDRTLHQIRDLGKLAGVALNPATPATAVLEVLHIVDLVLVMTVNPGFGGQSFIVETMTKLQTIAGVIESRKLDVTIEVDGGIAPGTAVRAACAGATAFVAGSAIFGKDSDYAGRISALRADIESARTQKG